MTRLLSVTILAMLTAAPAAAADNRMDRPGKGCLNDGAQTVGTMPGAAGVKRLDRLPPAAEILTVIRTEGGCMKPVVVRYGIAGNPRAGAPLRE